MQLILDGGLLFTLPILGIGLYILILIVQCFQASYSPDVSTNNIKKIKALSLFALVYGILGQLLGLMSGLNAIEQAQGVSPAILASGLYISSISTLLGLIIFLVARLGTTLLLVLNKQS